MNFERINYYIGIIIGSFFGMLFGSWFSYLLFLITIVGIWIIQEAMER